MAKIVYGVSGEGSGHSSRAREMAGHLVSQGHTVKIVSYARGVQNLEGDFDVFETEGLHIASVDNKVSHIRTFTESLAKLPRGHRKLQELRQSLFKEFQPDVVITDFEPMTAYLASHYDLPLISLDNQHRMRYMEYPHPPGLDADRLVTEMVIRMIVPRPDHSLVTSFYPGQPTNDRTEIFPPILRRGVLELEARPGDHIIVYFTGDFGSFLEVLRGFERERFLVYGAERDAPSGEEGPFTFRPFSQEGFLQDLAGAKAVMATAGFTLMTESLHLGKPYLALPMRGQFEQELNGFLLQELGLGKNVREVSRDAVASFLYQLPEFSTRLDGYESEGNRAIKRRLDQLLADDCALAWQAHRARKGQAEMAQGDD